MLTPIKPIAKFFGVLSFLLWLSAAQAQSITNPIAKLKDHITGVATLTAAQITTQGNTIQNNISQVGTNSVALAAALDLVDTYDITIGALFTTTSTQSGFARNGAGFELEQALFDLQQGILDNSYTSGKLSTYGSLLNGTKFRTSSYFPGAVAQPANTNQGYAVQINATHPKAWGSPVMYQTDPARRPTGCYLAPGSVAYVTVPAVLVNKGFNVRVGAHSWDLSAKDTLKRLDRVSLVYPITSATTRIGNPLGGGIYIEVPYPITNDIVTVGITNVVRSPFFSATFFHQTTQAEWLLERTNVGKWADFESDKFMMQVPRDWIYNFSTPITLMQDWDKAMDAVSDLMGRPQIMPKTVMYCQPDVLYRTTVNAPGYPMSNDPYNPNTLAGGNKNIYFLTGPQDSAWTTLHELGHAQSFTKFTGEIESAVHMNYVATMNQKFGFSMGDAMGLSIGAVNTPQNVSINLNQAALTWILVDKFRAGQPMADTDMKYQHRGHGKYVEIATLFGWKALNNFWHSVNVDYMNGIDYPENTDPTDSRIVRMSKAAGWDLRPLFHLWGMHPANAANLKTSIQNAGLQPSLAIYNRLKTYQGLVPINQTEFETHYSKVDSSLPGSDAAWYTAMHNNNTWTLALANDSIAAIQNIIDLYFPNGAPTVQTNTWDVTPGTAGAGNGVIDTATGTWSATTGNWTTNAGANNLIWADGSDAIFGTGTYTVNLGSGLVVRNLKIPAGGGSLTLKAATDNNTLTVVPDSVWTLNDNDLNIVADQVNDTSLTMNGFGALTVSGAGTFNTGEKPTGADWSVDNSTLVIQGTLIVRGNIGSVGKFDTVKMPAGSTYIHERNTPQTYANNWELTGTGQVTFENTWSRLYNLDGLITGTAGIIIGNLGTQAGVPQYVQLSNANTYTGLTTVMPGGMLKLTGGTNRINSGNEIVVDGMLELNDDQAFSSLTGSGTVTNNDGVLTVGRNTTVNTVSCAIAGNGILVKIGNASTTLTGASTYSGWTTNGSSSGLILSNSSALGSPASGTVLSSATSGWLGLQGDIAVGNEPLFLNGGIVSGNNAGGNLRNLSGTNSYGGLITLTTNATLVAAAGRLTLTNAGIITGSGFIITNGGSGDLVINSIIGIGTGGITKTGTGALTLSGANTYSGATTISAGKLVVNGSLAAGSAVTISSGATLSGNGIINGPVVIASGAFLAPGNSIGTLTLGIAPSLSGALLMEINRTNSPANCDKIVGVGVLAGTLTVTNVGPAPLLGDTFILLPGTHTGNFSVTNLPSLTTGLRWNWSATNGTLSVSSIIATTPTNIVGNLNGGSLNLSWPASHLGWVLQMQTNTLTATNWLDVPGSAMVTATNFPLNFANPAVYFRLRKP